WNRICFGGTTFSRINSDSCYRDLSLLGTSRATGAQFLLFISYYSGTMSSLEAGDSNLRL
ncbi:MAG TPA: hypothetical protein VF780_10665, partial [Nitrosospira sp.]